MNLFDEIIKAFNPMKGLQREMARRALRGFDGASRSRRTDHWRSGGADANSEIQRGQGLLRDRARDLRRNNPYAERGISAIAANVVGYGITPDPQGRKRLKTRALAKWRAWAETTVCDVSGGGTFYAMQHLAMESIAESGEVFVRRIWTPGENVMNFQVQLLEADYLDSNKNSLAGLPGEGYVESGIQHDGQGRIEGYWLFPQHPGGAVRSILSGSTSVFVPAADVAHIFLRRRPGQSRGYSWLAPVMLRMRNFDEMEDAVIEQAKIAACFAAIISGPDTGQALGPAAAHNQPLIERMEPGIIERVGLGETVTFGSPPTFNGYDAYSKQALRAFSVGLGIPYEVLTGDLNGVSFTSGRMGWLEFGRNIDVWRWHMIVPQLCARVWTWFNEAAALIPDGWEQPVPAGWVAPRRDLIDPTKELDAMEHELRLGLQSYSGALKERGINDTQAHINQISEDNADLDSAGLIFDGDPRNTAKAGAAVATTPATDTLAENPGGE